MQKKIFASVFLIFVLSLPLFPQEQKSPLDTLDFYEMSLEQLQNIKSHGVPSELEALINTLIASASKKALSTRETPSIVTLITDEEIQKSGARDLMDVLRLVPGLDFAVDVYGVVGIGVRGNWAHEGKVLLLWDGHEMNEILYGTLQFGNHFPVEQIKKIEIIRGPGSAIYGGYAEYGVINIVTKTAEEISGVDVSGIYGQLGKTFGRRNINLSVGEKIGAFAVRASIFRGEGNRSDQDASDIFGNTYNMAGNSKLNPMNVNVGFSYKNFSAKGMMDKYETTSQDAYTTILSAPYPDNFYSYFLDVKNIFKVNEKFSITPRFNFTKQLPWNWEGPSNDEIDAYDKLAKRYKGNLTLSYKFSRRINLILGGEYFNDFAENRYETSFFTNGEKIVSYNNVAVFTEAVIKHRILNVTLGARYDQHSNYGNAFSPRIALTKKFDRIHFKALYSEAFRAPSIENINSSLTGNIKPEKTQVGEIEIGYQLTRKMIVTANFFDITTKSPIIYYGISDEEQGYIDTDPTGTQGAELECRWKDKWGYLTANFSFYTAANKEKNTESVIPYYVPQENNYHLAFPTSKLNLNGNFKFAENWFVNPSILYSGKRYGYNSAEIIDDTTTVYNLNEFKSTTHLNLFVQFENENFSVGAGVYDILNEGILFIQPYDSYHAPLPGGGREFVFRMSYKFGFDEKK